MSAVAKDRAPTSEQTFAGGSAEAAVCESFPEPVFVLDASGRIVQWNRRAARFTGWTAEELRGTSPGDRLFAASSARSLRDALVLRLEREPRSAEAFADRLFVQLRRPGGETIPVELVLTEVTGGASRSFMAVMRRAQTGATRQDPPADLRQPLSGLLEQLQSPVVVSDGEGEVSLVNQAFCRRFGLPAETAPLLGADCRELFARIAAGLSEPESFLARLKDLATSGKAESSLVFDMSDGGAVSLDHAAAATPVGQRHLWMFHDVSGRQATRRALASDDRLLSRVGAALSHFVGGGDTRRLFEALLADALALTNSEYGFIGRVLYDADDAPYLKTYALTNLAWDDATRELFERHHAQGMEFRNLNTLFGRVLSTGEPVISNDPGTDDRRGGLPEGHPPLDAFLGLPLRVGSRLVGMLGVANRPGGYDAELLEFLQPFLSACANIIAAERAEQTRCENERRLAALSSVMLSLGADYRVNVGRLTAAAGQLLGADRAWYRRESGDSEHHELIAAWPAESSSAPGSRGDRAPGRELLAQLGHDGHPRVLQLATAPGAAQLEPELSRAAAGTWIAHVVEVAGASPGILNLAFARERRPDESELELVRIIGSAIATEETRLAGSDALLASEQRYADLYRSLDAVFTLSPDGFLSIGHDDRVVMASDGFTSLTGIDAGAVVGQDLAKVDEMFRERSDRTKPFAGLAAVLGQFRHVAATEAEWTGTIHLRFPRVCVLRSLVRVAAAPAGQVKAIVCLRDVTAETEVDRMKSEFLSTAAHELRTPMASVYGFSELLLTRDYDAATARELLETIHAQSGRLIQMLNELLDLARIEARAGTDFDMQQGPIEPLLVAAIREVVPPVVDRKIALDAAEDLPDVRFDRDKMLQVFVNVLANAVKYSHAGSAIRVLAARREETGQRWLAVSVVDRGIGMTPQQAARMFERFYRADPSGTVPGSGLGMSLVKEIVDIHGGRIEVESEPDRGTTITILLPAGG